LSILFLTLGAGFTPLCYAVSSRNVFVHLFVYPVNPRWSSDFGPHRHRISVAMRRPQGAPARDDPQCGSGVPLAGDAAPRETAPGSASGGSSRGPWPRARDQAFMGDSSETGDETCQRTGLEPWRRGPEGRQQKTPTAYADGGCVEKPCLTLPVPRRSGRGDSRGRSPDLRIILLANAFPAVVPASGNIRWRSSPITVARP
jgi:hypothetical protein